MRSHEYGFDVLAGGRRRRRPVPQLEAARGLVVEDAEGRFCGAIVGCDKGAVTLEDRHGKRRVFPLTPAAFLFEGKPVTLIRPAPVGGPGRRHADGLRVGAGAFLARPGGPGQPDLRRGPSRRRTGGKDLGR